MKTALITGVSRPLGLGFAVSRQLAEPNYHVILTARNVQHAEELAAELRRASYSATVLRLDLSDRTSIYEAADHLTRTFDYLDVLVNNASHMPDFHIRSALDVDLDALHAAFEVNVFGCWGLIQAPLPLLLRAPAARIVNVSSSAADRKAWYRYPLFAGLLIREVHFQRADYHARNATDPGRVASHPKRGDDNDDRSQPKPPRVSSGQQLSTPVGQLADSFSTGSR